MSYSPLMITLDERIARTQRLLRRLEDDQPFLRARLSPLGKEQRESAKAYAEFVKIQAEAELRRLLEERGTPYDWSLPQPAD